ncbi:protein kinase superfamily protein [Striga asiatica]|uniref:Protein kinase superfamily protein n=1 Tax=Striga asiatica TaxID=4170 RepID=A0A5A7PRM2_STRAF|nr:protein kinase superfamily protein [Striga asiatica]
MGNLPSAIYRCKMTQTAKIKTFKKKKEKKKKGKGKGKAERENLLALTLTLTLSVDFALKILHTACKDFSTVQGHVRESECGTCARGLGPRGDSEICVGTGDEGKGFTWGQRQDDDRFVLDREGRPINNKRFIDAVKWISDILAAKIGQDAGNDEKSRRERLQSLPPQHYSKARPSLF